MFPAISCSKKFKFRRNKESVQAVYEEPTISQPVQERRHQIKYTEVPHPSLTNPPDKRAFFDGSAVKNFEVGDSRCGLLT
jgi:hypothetical protein